MHPVNAQQIKKDNTILILGMLTISVLDLEFWVIKNFFQDLLWPKLTHFEDNTPTIHTAGMSLTKNAVIMKVQKLNEIGHAA